MQNKSGGDLFSLNEASAFFERSFTFREKRGPCYDLFPTQEQCFAQDIWEVGYLRALERDTNGVKALLNDKDIEEWGKHTALTDISSFIPREIRARLKYAPELLTRAWIKFYEILGSQAVIGKDCQSVRGLFLCEAPGAFVASTNHYLKSRRADLRFQWIATSLNPYYEGTDVFGAAIIDDSFISHPQTFGNWYFGAHNTGDILEPGFCESLEAAADCDSGALFDLVTGDAGINCVNEPHLQETLTLPLLFGEVLVALTCLKAKGSLVMKTFALFECQSLCLVYLLYSCFERITVFKPIASKGGNSELYVICIGFKPSAKLNDVLHLVSKNMYRLKEMLPQKALFPREALPLDFIIQFEECVSCFAAYQKHNILLNIDLYETLTDSHRKAIVALKKKCAKLYIKRYNLRSVEPMDTLTSQPYGLPSKHPQLPFNQLRAFVASKGSLNERKCKPWDRNELRLALNQIYQTAAAFNEFRDWKRSNGRLSGVALNFISGKKYNTIKCSKFCDPSLLTLYNEYEARNEGETRGSCKDSRSLLELQNCVNGLLENLLSAPLLKAKTSANFQLIIDCTSSPKTSSSTASSAFYRALLSLPEYAAREPELLDLETFMGQPKGYSISRKIFVIDCYCDRGGQSSCQPVEGLLVEKTLRSLCLFWAALESEDMVALHLHNCLSRITTNLLYLITCGFEEFASVPCLPSAERPQGMGGQLFLFTGKGRGSLREERGWRSAVVVDPSQESSPPLPQPPIIDCFTRILTHLKGNSSSSRDSDVLLEVIPVPVMLRDETFAGALFWGNVVQITEELKVMLNSETS